MTTTKSVLSKDYNQLLHELYSIAAENRQPISGTFELTERCNLACRMCYIRQSPCNSTRRLRELSAASWLDLARQSVDNGMIFLNLIGGEIFLRPDFFQIYEPLTHLGLNITLLTNGTLINNSVAGRLANAPPNSIIITLYGATATTYESVTGIPGSFSRCYEGIKKLIKCRIPLELKVTITRQNVGELDAMRMMAHKLGLHLSASWMLTKRRDHVNSKATDCRLSVSESISLEATDQVSVAEWIEESMCKSHICNDNNFSCHAGQASFVINSFGEMNVCLALPQPAVNLQESDFRDAWKNVQNYVDNAPPLSHICLACDARAYCSRCPAWSYLETKTLTEPVPYLCQIARARKELYESHV